MKSHIFYFFSGNSVKSSLSKHPRKRIKRKKKKTIVDQFTMIISKLIAEKEKRQTSSRREKKKEEKKNYRRKDIKFIRSQPTPPIILHFHFFPEISANDYHLPLDTSFLTGI